MFMMPRVDDETINALGRCHVWWCLLQCVTVKALSVSKASSPSLHTARTCKLSSSSTKSASVSTFSVPLRCVIPRHCAGCSVAASTASTMLQLVNLRKFCTHSSMRAMEPANVLVPLTRAHLSRMSTEMSPTHSRATPQQQPKNVQS